MHFGAGRRRRGRALGRAANIIAAVAVSALLLGVLGFGYAGIPALGPALDPGRGVWTSAVAGEPVTSQTLSLPGLQEPVTVTFNKNGIASIQAATDHDMFLALGYVHARFRLTEMDEERRLGEGRLAQLAGPSDLASDKFELQLGLLRTAQLEWAQMPRNAEAAQALVAYAQGVNDDIAQVRASGQWPATFTLAGVYPAPWTPVDSLVIQGELTQVLDLTTTPLDYALLERSLGAARTMAWFPITAPDAQTPYDPGPYRKLPLTPLSPSAASTTSDNPAADNPVPGAGTTARSGITAAQAQAASTLLAQLSQLPADQLHEFPDSNAWAANGPAVSDKGGSLLAGDPHLPQTLPSLWYEVAMSAPGFDVAGVSVPGLPGVLIGHNDHIAWSLTDTQNQATFFYDERTRGNQYYWDGKWRPMQVLHYDIPVRGAATVHLTVDLTVHGPIMTQAGQTTSVDWMGNVPSPDLQAMLTVNQSSELRAVQGRAGRLARAVAELRLRGCGRATSARSRPATTRRSPRPASPGCRCRAPAGATSRASSPTPRSRRSTTRPRTCSPPPTSARSPPRTRTTSAPAPTSSTPATAPPPSTPRCESAPLTPASFAAVQNSLTDQLAVRIVPKLLSALAGASLLYPERAVVSLLRTWHGTMATQFAAATVWWTFWGDYLSAVFQPWWTHDKVRTGKDRGGLASPSASSAWTRTWRRGRWTIRPTRRSRSRPARGGRAAGDAPGPRHRGRAPGKDARRHARRLDLGPPALPRVPRGQRRERPRLRPAPGRRRPVHPGRGRRRPDRERRPELADDRHPVPLPASAPRASTQAARARTPPPLGMTT